LISCSDDRTIRYWDQATGKQIRVDSCANQINNMHMGTSEQHIVTGHMQDVRVWSVKQGKVVQTIPKAH